MTKLSWILLALLAGYAAYNEYHLRGYSHLQWDAETAVCHVIPDHCK